MGGCSIARRHSRSPRKFARRCVAIIAVAGILFTHGHAAKAASVYELSIDPGLVLQHLKGPVDVVVTGNPFRYAWQVSVNQQIINPPAINGPLLPAGASTPAPAPNTTPLTTNIGGAPIATASPSSGQIGTVSLPRPSRVMPAAPMPDDYCATFPRFDTIRACLDQLQQRVNSSVGSPGMSTSTLERGFNSVCVAQLEYQALQRRTDEMLSHISFQSPAEKFYAQQDLRRLLGDDGNHSIDNATCGDMPAAGVPKPTALPVTPSQAATVASVRSAISRMIAYPTTEITAEQTDLTAVTAVIKNYTAARIDAESKADAVSVLASCAARQVDAAVPLATLKQAETAAAAARTTALQKMATATSSTAAALVAAFVKADTAYSAAFKAYVNAEKAQTGVLHALCEAVKQGSGFNLANPSQSGQAQIDRANADASSLQALLTQFSPTSSYEQQYAAAYQQMLTLRDTVLTSVSIDRFYVEVPEYCTDLFGSGRSTTISVMRYSGEQNSIIVDCPSRAFTSAGFAFSALPQQSYIAQSTNQALPQAPSGGPTPPPATIEESTVSSVRPIPVVLLNVRFDSVEPNDNGFYMSFGVSLNTSATTTTLDYLAGISYSLSRTLIVTAGASLSPQTDLAAGFAEGQPYAQANGTPPVTTRQKIAPFLAITYGAH